MDIKRKRKRTQRERKWSPVKNLEQLRPGRTIRHRAFGQCYTVTNNYGDHAIAVRAIDVTNPDEWEMLNRKS